MKTATNDNTVTLEDLGYYILADDIEPESVTRCMKFIIERNVIPKLKVDEIKLIINSNGGSVQDAFALIDVMMSSKIPISTHGLGTIASAGLAIFMAGTKGSRFVSTNTSILSHQYSWGSSGKAHELYARVKEFELTDKRMTEHYRRCTGLSDEDIKKYLLPERDVWLSSEEAVEFGLADKVVDFCL